MALSDPFSGLDNLLHREPHVRLSGAVDDSMLARFQDQIGAVAPGEDPVIVEVMTLGGAAETGRRLALDARNARARLNRRLIFLGKTAVYSAGVTFMSGFPQGDRFLTGDATLLIHSRQMDQTLNLSGPLRPSAERVRALLSEIENGLRVEREDFEALILGSDVPIEELMARATTNWYLPAQEAAQRRLVAGIV
jgi:hypothetical protein